MRSPRLFVWALGLLASGLIAQIPPGHAVVATRVSPTGGTGLFAVDLGSGRASPLGIVPSAGPTPLAICIDPVQGNLLLAVEIGQGSRLLRLALAGGAITREDRLADLPGKVTGLALAQGGSIVVATGGASGGVHVVARMGGVPRTLAALPRASAVHTHGMGSTHAWVAQSGQAGPPVVAPQSVLVDLSTGAIVAGPFVYTGHAPLGLTGMVDLPTAVPRQIFSQEDGTLAVSTAMGLPQVLTPPLVAGATQALRMGPDPGNLELVALGGQAHPYLKAIQGFQPQAWKILAGPLVGDPVDFDLAGPAEAGVLPFGEGCGGTLYLYGGFGGGPPRPGNATFRIEATGGRPSHALILALGIRDHAWGGVPLPLVLPGGCPLLVSAEIPVLTATGPNGTALLPLPVPADPALIGRVLFCQWLQPWGAGIETSNGGAIQVHP